ncbi:MAG: hypothetical protein BGO41_08230 [Clostridiales bacterium 38-18]|nr:MAG: hypothetical protein BGO41_08230 [Clostridiales bacterium 38-18]
MCTLAIAYKVVKDYPLIFLGNRDEFYKRPSQNATLKKGVICGTDLEKGGTWTGINERGAFAFITNYRDFTKHVDQPLSRGELTRTFLHSNSLPITYLNSLSEKPHLYDPYNLIVGDMNQLGFYSNIEKKVRILEPGVYGLSNGLLNSNWPKVDAIRFGLSSLIESGRVLEINAYFDILEDAHKYDKGLPDTGIKAELEHDLSALFIALDGYGTRFETVIIVDHSGQVQYYEKSRDEEGKWHLQSLNLQILK